MSFDEMRCAESPLFSISQNNFANIHQKIGISQSPSRSSANYLMNGSIKKEDIFSAPEKGIESKQMQPSSYSEDEGDELEQLQSKGNDKSFEQEEIRLSVDRNQYSQKMYQNDFKELHNLNPSENVEPQVKKVRVSNSKKIVYQQDNQKQKTKNHKQDQKITSYLYQQNDIKQREQKQSNFELQKLIQVKDDIIQSQQSEILSLKEQIENLKKMKADLAATSDIYQDHRKIRKIVQNLYKENSSLKRKLLKIELQSAKQRLGEYVKDGAYNQKWIQGSEVQDLSRQIVRIFISFLFYGFDYLALFQKDIEKKLQSLQNILENFKKTKNKIKNNILTISNNINNNKKPNNQFFMAAGSPSIELTQQQTIVGQDNNEEEEESDEEEFNFETSTLTKDEQKNTIKFQIQMLEKQKENLILNLTQKKREGNDIIKKIQLQNQEENSRLGGITLIDPWKVLGKRYQLSSLLGRGGFSEVYKALDLEELKEVAVKVHNIENTWNDESKQNYFKHALREHKILQELSHPNIVKLHGFIEINNNSFASVLEYCEGPDLAEYLKTNSKLNEGEAKSIVKKILDSLMYLNSFESKVIHYDLKPQNVIFHKGQVKITDFGLAKIIEDNQTRMELTSCGVGTYWYLPPECFKNGDNEFSSPKISSKVDIWSIGVIFYEMVYGIKPFGNQMTQQQILQNKTILNIKEVTFPAKPQLSKECISFITGCLKYRESERFDITQALNHPYFKKN